MSRNLTYKQKAFVNEFIESKNATTAAMKVYAVKNRNVAKSIGAENLSKPAIRESIEILLRSTGYDPQSSVKALIENQDIGVGVKATASDSIRASELLLKMSGKFVEKHQSISMNFNIDSLNNEELHKLKKEYDKLLSEV